MYFPPEILETIFKFLLSEPHCKLTLHTCALVSRAWLFPARRVDPGVTLRLKSRRTLDEFERLAASPHATFPRVKMERLVIRAYGPPRVYQDKDARPALDNPVQFLEWCGKPLPGRIAQHEPTTFAQILFASVKAMKMVEIRIGDGQEGLKARGAQKSFQELEEEGAIISKVAKSNLLSYFRSITHLDLDSVEFASPEDIWDVCHAFGPNLQTLVIQRLFLLGNNYVLGPSTSRIACPTVFPVLRTLEMYLRGPAMTYFLNCCVSLPSLDTLECDLSYYDLDKTSYKVMMRLFRELLSSASGLRTIIFTSDSTFHSNRAEAVGKLIGLSKHAPALVHLVIEPDLNGAAGSSLEDILSFLMPSPTLELFSIRDFAYMDGYEHIATFARNAPALKAIDFVYTVELEPHAHGADSDWYFPESETVPGSRYSYAEEKVPREGSIPWTVARDTFREIAERVPCAETRKLLRPVTEYQFN